MMDKKSSKEILERAAEKCRESGSKLTEKRAKILQILLECQVPLSAYEIADNYKLVTTQSMPPMSVYRILDFLQSEKLVHKLASENKYVACSHIDCGHDHEHEIPQFLICQKCQNVKEISVSRELIEGLQECVTESGYKLMTSQLELDCICDDCLKSTTTE